MDYYDPNAGSLPPLRPAALDAEAGGEGQQAEAEGTVAAPRKIEEHEVETYKEQDVSRTVAHSLSRRASATEQS